MERLSDNAIEILDDLHTERLEYNSEYLPLIEAAHKLAAYEDTGLEPEEVVRQSETLKLIDFNQRIKSDRLAEIAKAEIEGRLIVLPCKVGERFWFVEDGSIREYLVGAFETTGYGDLTVYDYDGIDRSPAYFTREQAEKALEGMGK